MLLLVHDTGRFTQQVVKNAKLLLKFARYILTVARNEAKRHIARQLPNLFVLHPFAPSYFAQHIGLLMSVKHSATLEFIYLSSVACLTNIAGMNGSEK